MKIRQVGNGPGDHCTILSQAIENTNEAFVTIDRDSTVILFNRAAEQMFGYHREEVIGHNIATILSPGCRHKHQQAVERYLATGSPRMLGHETEFDIVRKDGKSFPAAQRCPVRKLHNGIQLQCCPVRKLQRLFCPHPNPLPGGEGWGEGTAWLENTKNSLLQIPYRTTLGRRLWMRDG